jgi:putrescine transport system substrate-binding protein
MPTCSEGAAHPAMKARIAVTALACMLAACSGDPKPGSPAAHDAPESGRVVNVFNWTDFIDPTVITGFEKEYGIKVNYGVYETNEQLETTLLTGHSNYDVAVPGGAFFERGVKAGLYTKLDKSLLPNLAGVDPEATAGMAAHDPGNLYGVDYMWLTTVGIGYDATRIRQRMADAPVDSWRMIFDPQVLRHFQDCGVSVLDSPEDVVSAVMFFLGKHPNAESLDDLKEAERVLLSIRPYIRSVNSANYIGELANGDLCLALGWAGDITQARWRSREAGKPASIDYRIPREGSINIFDVLVIPAGAPHAHDAHLFINYLLRPEIAAKNTNATKYANSVLAATALVNPQLTADPGIYPPAEVRQKLIPPHPESPAYTRAMNRMWTKFRTGT